MTTSPTVLRLASRLDEVGFSDIVKLRNRIMELRNQGATVYQFEGGEPFMPTPGTHSRSNETSARREQNSLCAIVRHSGTSRRDRGKTAQPKIVSPPTIAT